MQKLTTFLWFNDNAEEAVNFYISVFKTAKVGKVVRCGDAGPGPKGSVLTMGFEIEGQEFAALNGGPYYQLTPAISFVVNCESQDEVDYYWEKFTADGGKPLQCGWVTDKFGVTWQVVPTKMFELINSKDAEKSGRAMGAMMQMVKLDIKTLQAAYDGK